MTAEHGHRKAVRGKPPVVHQQFPCETDSAVLEVVPHGEVAQHFEEGVVGAVAHLVDVRGAETLLHAGQAPCLGHLLPQEVGFELLHACGGQQDGGVVGRDQGRGADLLVALTLEILEKFVPNPLCRQGFHFSNLSISGLSCAVLRSRSSSSSAILASNPSQPASLVE